MSTEYPEAIIRTATPNKTCPGMFVVTVDCPYACGVRHLHGWEPGDHTPRVAHCAEGNHLMYVLTDPTGSLGES